ncbi:unnamed protein product [Chondrus crispus]|uniref:Uncharacterized protein n=1 Tax=Chondrus crispus TaxID=2769 RepID=R7QRJ4_CHOCR|nr:unnamed protein product [Chondrus crispus]CDF41112.1 unnamed protein product [Chondrus crispus]|eukprot:XP_005711406.1 unnamed protein product [Chondrus crispus]
MLNAVDASLASVSWRTSEGIHTERQRHSCSAPTSLHLRHEEHPAGETADESRLTGSRAEARGTNSSNSCLVSSFHVWQSVGLSIRGQKAYLKRVVPCERVFDVYRVERSS